MTSKRKVQFDDEPAPVSRKSAAASASDPRTAAKTTSQPSSSTAYMTRNAASAVDASEESEPDYYSNTVRMRLRCHRSGAPAGQKQSKKVGCPHVVDVEVEVDEDGQVWAIVTEQCGHYGHTPGTAEDRRHLPLSPDLEAYIAKVSCII